MSTKSIGNFTINKRILFKLLLTLFILCTVLTTYSCKSQQINQTILLSENKTLMNHIFDDFEAKYRDSNTLNNNKFISDKILYKPSVSAYSSWEVLILKSSREILPLAINFDVAQTKKRLTIQKYLPWMR